MSNGKSLYLHIGAHKTASSFLQSLLKNNIDALKKRGLKVVSRGEIIESPFYAALNKINKGESKAFELEQQVEPYGALISKDEGDVLFTNEDMFSTLKLKDFYQNIEESVKFCQKIYPDHDVKLILYVRNQPDYIESKFVQYIHLGRSFSFEDFLEEDFPKHLDWHKAVVNATSVLGKDKVIVKPYESIFELGQDEFFYEFLECVGVNDRKNITVPTDLGQKRGANRSYSGVAIEIAKRVNPLLEKDEKRKLRNFLQTHFSTATHPRGEFFSNDQKKQILGYYLSGNKALFQEFIKNEYACSREYYNIY